MAWVRFDDDDRHLGTDVSYDPEDIDRCRRQSDLALAHAISYQEFMDLIHLWMISGEAHPQCERLAAATARIIRNYQPVVVPGLLHTPGYARRVFEILDTPGQHDVAAFIAARMDRQAILHNESRRFEFLIAEAALRWRLGPPDVMLAQLDRIGLVATLPNVAVGLIPQIAEVTGWPDTGFIIYEDREEQDPIVHTETLTAGLTISDSEDVERYRRTFDRLRESAVFGEGRSPLSS